jgi:hypothetical protein
MRPRAAGLPTDREYFQAFCVLEELAFSGHNTYNYV